MRKTIHICALVLASCAAKIQEQPTAAEVLPVPKEMKLRVKQHCLSSTISFFSAVPELDLLYDVLRNEFLTYLGIELTKASSQESAQLVATIDSNARTESYQIIIDDKIHLSGSNYGAVAMASITLLQSMRENRCLSKGKIQDWPDKHYRGILIDVARRPHDIETLKRIVMLCRWYKVNYLQLHLTDDQLFTFPSQAFPELPTPTAHFTEDELKHLADYAFERGVELVPELEVPGHSAQMIGKLPRVFGFDNPALNRTTINMAKHEAYSALDTLVGEISRIFYRSKYIHIGGDETDFDGMENDAVVKSYLQQQNLQSVEELYWHFLNRMNEFVKKRGKKTIVWEGFSKEANSIISKDIVVMAWETIYQMPQDLLDAGFEIINVSWKPLYVVNVKKWDPLAIYRWNIFTWGNWVPKMPSYHPFTIPDHPKVVGASLASWDQPAHTEISSLRKRIPAMCERVWNMNSEMGDQEFLDMLRKTDSALHNYLSPIDATVRGLTYPEIEDGHYDEQTWFHDTVYAKLEAKSPFEIRYSLDGSPVSTNSHRYVGPLQFYANTTLKCQAFQGSKPVGAELLYFFELRPLIVHLDGEYTIPRDSLWETTRSWLIGFKDSMVIQIKSKREGQIRYALGAEPLTANSPRYLQPIIIRDTSMVKAGLFIRDSLIGKPWIQHFQREQK